MKTLLLSSLLIIMLFTTNIVWADLPPSTSLKAEIPQTTYSYKTSNGTTVVLGEVQNDNDIPIYKVTVYAKFMNSDGTQIIESDTGTTLLQVIPPHGKSPFMISSTKSDPSIATVQVNMGPFDSAAVKQQMLDISPGLLQVSDKLILSGSVHNNGAQQSLDTKVYLVLYDAFQRVVRIGVSNPIDVNSAKDSQFSVTSDLDPRAISYMLVAESDVYQSKPIQNSLKVLPVDIVSTTVTDSNGTSYSTIPVNASAKITSDAKYVVNSTQPFIYYVQVKQFSGQVEFIGKYEGVFLGPGDQNVSVDWKPHTAGSYFIETYVWNYDTVPLSSAAPSINVVLVK
jgi:hypothetical protein